MEGSDLFRIEKANGVARCSMNGPRMNAMGMELVPALAEGLRSVLDDEEVRVIVIRGEGGNFSTGADLTVMGEKMDPVFLSQHMRVVGGLVYELHEGPKPVIAEVDGWAVGGGFGLACAADLTYATERARFFLSFVRISLVPDLGTSYLLTKRVGLAKAKELALTGKVIGAEEALSIGLVNQVIPHEEISNEVMKVATAMAERSTLSLEMIKRFLNTAHSVDLRTFLDMEAFAQSLLVMTPEHKRDVEKFLKKDE